MLLASLRSLAGSLVEALRTRLELLSLDLEEAKLRLLSLLLLGALAFLGLALGTVLAAFWLVAAYWDTPHRLLVMGLLTGAFLGGGLLALLLLGWKARLGPPLFSATIEELRRDRDALGGDR
jgi:uncharacterized membrane protein YqjE